MKIPILNFNALVVGLYLFFPIVFPNSFRGYSVSLFVALGLYFLFLSDGILNKTLLSIYYSGLIVSFFYIFVGSIRGEGLAFESLVFVYMIAPLLWLTIWSKLLLTVSIEKILILLLIYGFFGSVTVVLFFYFFNIFGGDTLTWLIAEPNVQFNEDGIGATMHVYGSLIFIAGGFFAAPNIVLNKSVRFILFAIFFSVALVSGRSALVLSLFSGFFINLLNQNKYNFLKWLKIFYLATALILILLIIYNLNEIDIKGFGVNIFSIFADFFIKVFQGGGDERVLQSKYLVDGILDTYFLGAGHGIGVPYVRNDINPWRYELLWLATFYRVGLIGFLIYSIPFYYIYKSYRCLGLANVRNGSDIFVYGGFVAILIASATNPYLESFDFQWMVVFPGVYFYYRFKSLHNIK